MNALEHQLDYPFADALPEPARLREVAPGVRWVRMPLPFALDHINLWLLRDEIDGREGLDHRRLRHRQRRDKAHWEQVFEHELGGCRCCA